MSKQEVTIPLSSLLLLPEGGGINKIYIDIMMEEEIPVLCVNQSTDKKRLMPFKVMYGNNESFWRQSGGWQYFVTGEGLEKLKEKAVAKTGFWIFDRPKTANKAEEDVVPKQEEEELEELQIAESFGSEYKIFVNMTIEERVEHLKNDKKRLNDLITQKSRNEAVITKALVDTTKSAAMINHAVLEEAIRLVDDEAKKATQGVVDSTKDMVKSSAHLISEEVLNDDLMNTLVEKSNGTIVQHMTRVYINGVAFLTYYNNLVSGSSAIQKIRISFASKYREYYHSLLPHINIDDIILERVFYRGMRSITPDLYFKWAVGFLIHDIGKAAAVEYHESELSYDRNTVIDHVRQGYDSIVKKTNYSKDAGLIAAYHHEYYDDPSGYGNFRDYFMKYKKLKPEAKHDYCITYELESIMDYTALAYFPAKILEIIDVYDSLTDKQRTYRKPMTPEEALNMMREEFIEKHLKLDPILLDIFETFIHNKEKQKR